MIPTGLIGVVHLPALPGDPRHDGGGFGAVEAFALRDAEALVEGGVRSIIVENFGSVPFVKGTAGFRTPPLTPEDATHDCVDRGLADAVIVTGSATGAPVDADLLRRVASAAGAAPVLVGSGLTPDNVDDLVPHAHGAIVGTWLKRDGDVAAPVDAARVAELAGLVSGRWRAPVPSPATQR